MLFSRKPYEYENPRLLGINDLLQLLGVRTDKFEVI